MRSTQPWVSDVWKEMPCRGDNSTSHLVITLWPSHGSTLITCMQTPPPQGQEAALISKNRDTYVEGSLILCSLSKINIHTMAFDLGDLGSWPKLSYQIWDFYDMDFKELDEGIHRVRSGRIQRSAYPSCSLHGLPVSVFISPGRDQDPSWAQIFMICYQIR